MNERRIYITEKDKAKLQKILSSASAFRVQDQKTLQDLKVELERAEVMAEEKMDDNVIRMHSTVFVMDMKTNAKFEYQLVYPNEADLSENKISILAPIGTALLGYKVGDIIEWSVPAGLRKLKIEDVRHSQMQD
ncbi:MAG: nucleoside diphosphate kinase regulator [Ignavibacteriae bacterium]|jgi:regulator of nucleoside diphosphate kinase|nr:nucleoside diphosphate kinase regulator [Ignavibacteriota bacterium]NOG98645.1 nucleoside diphosphate kinase regulator [Ignavibacteriota bacterium]